MSNFVVEYFCRLCYIQCMERFHDDDIDDGMADLTYEFIGSQDIYNRFADREMGCTGHIDYFSLCLMNDDRTFRKSSAEMSEGYRVILTARLLVSTYLSVLHYQSFLGISYFTPSVILHCKLFYTLSHFTL
jgi:hypothetical protein